MLNPGCRHLVDYVRAAQEEEGVARGREGRARPVRYASQDLSYRDEDIVISVQKKTYAFSDGVVIAITVEEDPGVGDSTCCARVSVLCEVLSSGEGEVPVMPARKVFDNACQLRTWLAFH